MQKTLNIGLLAALLASQTAVAVPVTLNGGGAASQQFVYAAPNVGTTPVAEMPLFGALQTTAQFGTYWSTTSSAAQTGLFNNDLSCIANASTGSNGGKCNGTVGGANTVHYAISETALTTAQVAAWATSTIDAPAAGNLIQLPMLGTGLAIVVNEPGTSANGQVQLTDDELCEIFSGKITDFSQIQNPGQTLQSGPLTVVYRSDKAGTTFLLTNHLSAVCNSKNSNIIFTPTSSFSGLWGTASLPPNFVGVSGLSLLANTLAGLSTMAYRQAISYISPDWTSVDSGTSSAKLSNNAPSPLLVATLRNGKTYYLPTAANIALALKHPWIGQALTWPTDPVGGANPVNWVPVIQTTHTGYPIVGFSSIEVPQCYATPAISTAMITFLKDHYKSAAFLAIQANNGLASVANDSAGRYTAIVNNLLNNKNGWNDNIGNQTACTGKAGR